MPQEYTMLLRRTRQCSLKVRENQEFEEEMLLQMRLEEEIVLQMRLEADMKR